MKTKILIILFISILLADSTEVFIPSQIDTNRIVVLEEKLFSTKKDIDSIKAFNSNISDIIKHKAEQEYLDDKLKIIDERFNEAIIKVKRDTDKLDAKLIDTKKELKELINKVDNYSKSSLTELNDNISNINNELEMINSNIDEIKSIINNEWEDKFSRVEKNIQHSTLYWIIGLFLVLTVLIVLFFFFRLKIIKQKNSLQDLIYLQKQMEEKSINIDENILKLFEQTFKKENLQISADHSLPLKVADEIQRIRNRIKYMVPDDHSTKVIQKRIESLEDELLKRGYEIINLEGKPYNDGMRVHANFINDEGLKEDEKVIYRVIKPQVNYKGEMIQVAEIEVKQGV